MKIITQSLYTSNNKVASVDISMDYTKDVNIIPYEKYGDMLSSGELIIMGINYKEACTIVRDGAGGNWKVTYRKYGFKAVLTRVG